MRNIHFASGEYYHVYNRGTEKRDIFLDDFERQIFIQQLSEFNQINHQSDKSVSQKTIVLQKYKEPYVKIHGFCLMSNHFHLLLQEVAMGGISQFMQRIGLGYTGYFNKKHSRSGRLFEGPYKVKHVNSTEYLIHLSRYIHLNPLDLVDKSWRDVGIVNQAIISDYLCKYRWSSYKEYIGKSEFPFVTTDVLMQEFKGQRAEYTQFVLQWVQKDLLKFPDIPFL